MSPQPATTLSNDRIPVEHLLKGRKTVFIHHQGQDYTLRLTRAGKLLLTK